MSARDRRLGRVCAVLFGVSTLFPFVAGFWGSTDPPRLLGIVDVTVAAMLVVAALLVDRRTGTIGERQRAHAYDLSQRWSVGVLALLAVFLVGRPRIRWDVLVAGLAWRGWLLIYVLPELLAALQHTPRNSR